MEATNSELVGVVGFHPVTKEQARDLIQPHIQTDGFYILRPSTDPHGSVLCTICVTNKQKLVNYRLVRDKSPKSYYIYAQTKFRDIHQLLEHYSHNPINAEVNTRLLYPITPAQDTESLDGEGCYVVMEHTTANADVPQPSVNSTSPQNDSCPSVDDNQIPGLHLHLPKQEINTVMQNYLSTDGNYLLRPSATSAGQLTLAVSHSGKVLNFKISFQNNEYFLVSRRRFKSIQALLTAYHKNPMKSKRTGNEKVFLRTPIPVDPNLEKKFKENEATVQPTPLPEPWQEHFHTEYQRPYYYNPSTGISVWERPRPSKQPQRAKTMPSGQSSSGQHRQTQNRIQSRPLPAPPGSDEERKPPLSEQRLSGSSLPIGRRKQLPPPTRQSSDSDRHPPPRRGPSIDRALPPLPPKDDEVFISPFRSLPPLPPKEETDGGWRATGPPVLPQRGNSTREQRGRPMAPLPPKEPDAGAVMTSLRGRPLPQLPPISERELPPLPPKDDRPLPPLPPKNDEVSPSPPVPSPGTGRREEKQREVVKYKDTTMLNGRYEEEDNATTNGLAPTSLQNLPPLPEKIPPNVPPPPPVASNIPAPPPLPPQASPSQLAPPPPPPPPQVLPPPPPQPPPPPSPNSSRERPGQAKQKKPANESTQNGRPFTANDLQAAKNLLRAAAPKDSPDSPDFRRYTMGSRGGGGLADVFASAIDTRMGSIRKATQDSDESEFEDVEDDEEWSD